MYLEHFGLKELPFSIAPNPHYLYLSLQHQEALAHLMYGLDSSGGVILLTGEVGAGKTTIGRKLLEDMPKNIDLAWIVNPRLSADELLATICDELGISYPKDNHSIKIFTDLINTYLIDAHSQGNNVILMIDEAQNLSPEVLEQLRLLTNLETSRHKLLQIVLLGQPELKMMLERNDLRQLAQRITARYHLGSLSRMETGEYICHRLSIAGCSRPVFSQQAMQKIYRVSGGTPRLINLLCDRAMLGVYSCNGAIVNPSHVRQACKEVLGEDTAPTRGFLIPAIATVVLIAAGVLFVVGPWPESETHLKQAEVLTLQPPVASEVVTMQAQESVQLTSEMQSNRQIAAAPITNTNENMIAQNKLKPAADFMATPPSPSPDSDNPWAFIEQTGTKMLALQTLAKIWKVETNMRTVDPCAHLSIDNLFCLQQNANIWLLTQLNRPAVFRIVDQHGQDHFAVIQAIKHDRAIIQLDRKQWEVTLSELESKWQNHITLIWSKPPGYKKDLQQGDRGKAVTWLAGQLDRIQGTMTPPRQTDSMDALLVERLKDFQASQGLPADGIAGPLTLIRMNEKVGLNTPKLQAKVGI